LSHFYRDLHLGEQVNESDHLHEKVRRSFYLSRLMQKYALQSVGGNTSGVPYFLAMLEWVLPVVCYRQATLLQKRLSFILAAILFEKLGMD
jgi:hypothetical protein